MSLPIRTSTITLHVNAPGSAWAIIIALTETRRVPSLSDEEVTTQGCRRIRPVSHTYSESLAAAAADSANATGFTPLCIPIAPLEPLGSSAGHPSPATTDSGADCRHSSKSCTSAKLRMAGAIMAPGPCLTSATGAARALGCSRGSLESGTAVLRFISTRGSPGGDVTAGLTDHEKTGVPHGAGQDGENGFDLGRMRRLLGLLGDPQLSFPVVQVAGTKGKGSTAALLSNVLRASGYSVGTYSSPHVMHESERLWCGKAFSCISPLELGALKERHMPTVELARAQEGPALSYFEVMTGLAFKLFEEHKVDVAVVEAGLGGARDATNVFPATGQLLSILTAIGSDHKAALGDTVGEIAAVKAGIVRDGRPIVLAHQPEAEARDAVVESAAKKGSLLLDVDADVLAECGDIQMNSSNRLVQTCSFPASRKGELAALRGLEMQLLGREQVRNAAAVIRACWQLASQGWNITPEAVREGFASTALPGRCEVLSIEKDGRRQWLALDAAHTPESGQSLSNTIRQALPDRSTVLVWAMLDDKDIRGFARTMRSLKPKVVIFTVGSGGSSLRHANSGVLAGAWQIAAMADRDPETRRVRSRELVMASMEAAMAKAFTEVQSHEGEGLMVVTGSFSAVAAAKATMTCRDFFPN